MKIVRPILLALVALGVIALPVLAASYTANISVIESNVTSYTMLPIKLLADVAVDANGLVAQNFISSTGLDTRVVSGGSAIPHMLATDRIMFAQAVPKAGNITDQFTTGNTALASFYVIPGYNGYVTVADAANLQLANSFTIVQRGYIDTSAGKVLLSKQDAFVTYATAGTITSSIVGATVSQIVYNVGDNNGVTANGVNWYAQTFTTAGGFTLARIRLKFNTGVGLVKVSIRAVTGGLPTGADLTSAFTLGADISAGSQFYTIDVPPIALAGATPYAIIVGTPTASDQAQWREDTLGGYAGGQAAHSVDSGVTWIADAGTDFLFETYTATLTSVSVAATPSVHTVTTSAVPAGNLSIQLDAGAPVTTPLAGASVNNTTNTWLIGGGNAMPYMEYLKITTAVGGASEKLWFQPVSYISGTALPDRDGADNNGTFTWGSNPSDITVSLGALLPTGVNTGTGSGGVGTQPIVPIISPSGNVAEGTGSGLPFGPIADIMFTVGNIPYAMTYGFAWLTMVLFALIVVGGKTHHMALGLLATVIATAALVATKDNTGTSIIPWAWLIPHTILAGALAVKAAF